MRGWSKCQEERGTPARSESGRFRISCLFLTVPDGPNTARSIRRSPAYGTGGLCWEVYRVSESRESRRLLKSLGFLASTRHIEEISYDLVVSDGFGLSLGETVRLISGDSTYWATEDGSPHPSASEWPEPYLCKVEGHQRLDDGLLGRPRVYFIALDLAEGEAGLIWHAELDGELVIADGASGEDVSLAELTAGQQ